MKKDNNRNKLKTLYRKLKPLPYHKEVEERLTPIYKRIKGFYYDENGGNAYNVRTHKELKELDTTIIGLPYEDIIWHVEDSLDRYMKEYSKDFKGLLFYKNGDMQIKRCLNEPSSKVEQIKSSCGVFDVGEVLESALYRGFLLLKAVFRKLKTIEEDKELLTYFNTIARQQEVIDYIIKLERIGEDEEVFIALLNKEDAYIKTLFEPLELILQQLQEKKELSGDEKLEQIISWSSTQLLEVEAPSISEIDLSNITTYSMEQLTKQD